jgi:ribonucleoside-diphosphate reductase alpha chain
MTEFTNFNISVALTDPFMAAVESGKEYDLIDPNSKEVVGILNAREVFNKIVDSAWGNGDPGIVFIDRINRANPTPHVGEIESTNPCGEQPLLPYESCNLGSINLAHMIDEQKGGVDWSLLQRITHLAVRFLDDVIDMNNYPIEKISEMTRANRKIGLGVMGWADMLIKMGIPYNSEMAIKLADEVMSFIDTESKKASRDLAKTRGAFPNYIGSIFDKPGTEPIRNATTTTIAPTGTISIIAGCSSGIEPLFALSYIRSVMDKDRLVEVHPIFEQVAKERGFYSDELMERVAYAGHIEEESGLGEDVRETFVTAHGVSPEWHIRMQAAFQGSTDNAVSKTVNFANEATIDDVKNAYQLAYQLQCKGITIYRDGSRSEQVLSTGSTYAKEEAATVPAPATIVEVHHKPKPRPEVMEGHTQKINTGCGAMYVTINHDQESGEAFEIFTQMGKAGGCASSQNESIGRLASLALRSGVDVAEIQKQLSGISCHMPAWEKGAKITSCADAISKAIGRWRKISDHKREEGVEVGGNGNGNGSRTLPTVSLMEVKTESAGIPGGACPDCGGALEHLEGCLKCTGCGYSKC